MPHRTADRGDCCGKGHSFISNLKPNKAFVYSIYIESFCALSHGFLLRIYTLHLEVDILAWWSSATEAASACLKDPWYVPATVQRSNPRPERKILEGGQKWRRSRLRQGLWQGQDGHFAILAGYLEVRALWISMSMVGWWLSFARHIPSWFPYFSYMSWFIMVYPFKII